MRKVSGLAVVVGLLIVSVLILWLMRVQWPFPWRPRAVPPETVPACIWFVKGPLNPSGTCSEHCSGGNFSGGPFNIGGTPEGNNFACCPDGYTLARNGSSWVCNLVK